MIDYNELDNPNYQYVVIEVGDDFPGGRDAIVAALQAENILARKYFWPGCHKMKPYRDLFPHAGLLLPRSEDIAARIVVLPTGMNLPEHAIETVGKVIRAVRT